MKFYEYTVQGSGPFPLDMLRYDNSWPATQEDVCLINENLRETDPVRICLRGIQVPHERRWATFLWQVVGPIKVRVP